MMAYNDASNPGVEQENGTDEEGAGQRDGDRQQEPVSEPDVLLPEQEGVSVRVAEHALAAKLLADGPHTFDGLYKVAGVAKVVQVEGELSELQGFSSWNCKQKCPFYRNALRSVFKWTKQWKVERTLTVEVLPSRVIPVVYPLSGRGVEVSLG